MLNLTRIISMMSLLFGVSARAQMGLEGFQSGRYEVRKTTVLQKTTDVPAKMSTTKRKPDSEPEKNTPAPLPIAEKPSVETENPSTDKVEEPNLSEQMGSLFSKEANRIYDFYKKQRHQDDIRQNKVELDFSPYVANIESKSNYSPRDFHTSYQGLDLGARVWLTPLIGVTGHMNFSMAGSVGEAGEPNNTPTYFEDLRVAGRFRTFFESELTSKSVELSVHYIERKFQPGSDSETRIRTKSQSIGLGLQTRLPTSSQYAWTFGGVFYPRTQHSESILANGYSSGGHQESVSLDLSLGGEWKLSRHHQIFWDLQAELEKNSFSGSAVEPDPVTGVMPRNINVDQSSYLLKLGYRWGH